MDRSAVAVLDRAVIMEVLLVAREAVERGAVVEKAAVVALLLLTSCIVNGHGPVNHIERVSVRIVCGSIGESRHYIGCASVGQKKGTVNILLLYNLLVGA